MIFYVGRCTCKSILTCMQINIQSLSKASSLDLATDFCGSNNLRLMSDSPAARGSPVQAPYPVVSTPLSAMQPVHPCTRSLSSITLCHRTASMCAPTRTRHSSTITARSRPASGHLRCSARSLTLSAAVQCTITPSTAPRQLQC